MKSKTVIKNTKAIVFLLFLLISQKDIQAQSGEFKTYSKFDFVSGEKVVAFENFDQDQIGDFPAKWNTNGSGEIVLIEGTPGRWLKINSNTTAFPTFVNNLPENFTLEFMIAANPELNYAARFIAIIFTPNTEQKKLFTANFPSRVRASFTPLKGGRGKTSVDMYGADSKAIAHNEITTDKFCLPQKSTVKVSVWRQKTRLRIYLDEEKVWDLPTAFDASVGYKKVVFGTSNLTSNMAFYISDVRLAVGAPDTRSKLITDGKFTTTGILFDSNSDKIKPESYGILKQISQVLQENPTLKVRIIGHTDSDGEDTNNLDLSKRRAASVKANLSREFSIESSRLQTDGQGETQPIAPNTTPEGKANNRRVEFIKL
ncbi:OmpA family protein [Runella aurantiaca]|uniref:OmpA family protein n=1 Tax=Runella aurantiaca TaxID=2282308 RepID=A0A369I700_9BACT|nr:OmpA family protein [Runella aurantiaca]RDB04670.1 OmpA family protein [Runella aurantiaca]